MFIEAARARGEALDHVLLAGPPGLGKTSLAQIVANELGVEFTLTAGPALERKGDVASYLTALEPRSVFFVDEIHRLPRALEETFYPAMEDRKLPITVGQGAGAKVVTLDLPAFTLIGATTRAGLLTTPLRDRFGVTAPARAVLAAGARPDRAALGRHPRRGDRRRGRGGDRRRARAARRGWPTACSSGCATSPRCAAPGSIDARVAREALELLEVDEAGLDRLDRDILRSDLREVRRRPGRAVHAERGGGGGVRHDRGRLRALPAPAGLPDAHPARPRGDRRRVRPPRPGGAQGRSAGRLF